MKMITVFTPTYNRMHLLKRLYESLKRQTEMNFEWVLVDDASTDGTDLWVESIIEEAPFDIKYRKTSRGGKHRAINVGVGMSSYEFFFIVDSDDYLPSYAIATVNRWINDAKDIDYLAGVAGLRIDSNDTVIGERPKSDQDTYIECTNIDRYRMNLQGDKAEIYRTNILKKYPFPEYDGELFLTESIVWDRIAYDGYKLRWYNTPIYYCEYNETGLTKSGANALTGHLKNYRGYLEHVRQSIKILDPLEVAALVREYNYTARKNGKNISERAKDIGMNTSAYINYLLLKMPAYYLIRILIKIGIFSAQS